MKSRASVFLAAALLAAPVSAKDIAPISTSPVVILGDSQSPFCTAFFISETLLLTAGHCVFDDPHPTDAAGHPVVERTTDLNDLKILPQDANFPEGLRSVHVVASSDPFAGLADWALLQIDAKDSPKNMTPLKLDCAYVAAAGDSVTTLGFPGVQSGNLIFGMGYINGEDTADTLEETPQFSMTLPVSGGASGSPLEHNGLVVGIITAENSVQPAWSYAQPVAALCGEVEGLLGG